jgi:hypothetical protein
MKNLSDWKTASKIIFSLFYLSHLIQWAGGGHDYHLYIAIGMILIVWSGPHITMMINTYRLNREVESITAPRQIP